MQIPETNYVMKNLVAGVDYEFRAAAENKAGLGPFSPPSMPITAREPIGKLDLHHEYSIPVLLTGTLCILKIPQPRIKR